MTSNHRHFFVWYWILAIAGLTVAMLMALCFAPADPSLGPVQKLFYLHVPTAATTFLVCLVVFIGNAGYIWQRSAVWDDLSSAAAEIAFLYCSVVLVTGVIWARSVWEVWWTWSPLLTFSLALWLLYLGYLMVHRWVQPAARREIACAVYGLIAFVDVPLVYLSVKLLPDRHPSQVHLSAAMVYTLLVWFIPVIMFGGGLIWLRTGHHRRIRLGHCTPAAAPVLAHQVGPLKGPLSASR